MKKLFTLIGGALLATSIGAYAVQAASEDAEAPQTMELETVLFGGEPMFISEALDEYAPVDLEEYELGVGFLNIYFGGAMELNDVSAPISLSGPGGLYLTHEVTEENLIVWDENMSGMSDDDDPFDPGMMGNAMSILEVDFDQAITANGEYCLTIPAGLLKYADGTLIGGGEIWYVIGDGSGEDDPTPAAGVVYDITPRPYDEGLDNFCSELTTFTISVSDLDYTALTLNEGFMGELVCEDLRIPLDRSTQMSATSVAVYGWMGAYAPGTYTLEIPEGAFTATQLDGKEVSLGAINEEYIINVNAEEGPYEFMDLIMDAEPYPDFFGEGPVDLDSYTDGLAYANFMVAGHWNMVPNCDGVVTLSCNGEVVAEAQVYVFDDSNFIPEVQPSEGDDIDPGFGMGDMGYSIVMFDFGQPFTAPGEYAISIPDGMFYANNFEVAASEIWYVIEEPAPAIVAYDITPRPYDEGLENEVNSLTRFTLNFSEYDYASIEAVENAEIALVKADGKALPLNVEAISETSFRLTLPMGVYVPGTYTLEIPAESFIATQFDGKTVPVQAISEEYVIAVGEPIAFEDLITFADPDFREDIDLAEVGGEISYINFMLGAHIATVEGAKTNATVKCDGKAYAICASDAVDYSPSITEEDDVDPGMTNSAESVVLFNLDKAINAAGKYTLIVPDGLFWANNSPVLGCEIEYSVVDTATGIDAVVGATEYNVTDLFGRNILRGASADQVNALGKGLYIVNGVKIMKR